MVWNEKQQITKAYHNGMEQKEYIKDSTSLWCVCAQTGICHNSASSHKKKWLIERNEK